MWKDRDDRGDWCSQWFEEAGGEEAEAERGNADASLAAMESNCLLIIFLVAQGEKSSTSTRKEGKCSANKFWQAIYARNQI